LRIDCTQSLSGATRNTACPKVQSKDEYSYESEGGFKSPYRQQASQFHNPQLKAWWEADTWKRVTTGIDRAAISPRILSR